MQDRKSNRRLSLGLIAGISLAVLAAGGGAAWWAKHSLDKTAKSNYPPIESTQPKKQPETKPLVQEEKVALYWLNASENKIKLSFTTIPIAKSADNFQERILESALKTLLAGPEKGTEKVNVTTIPKGTKLLSLTEDAKGIHINLSQEFTSGGGSESMTGRLAQVLYTATSLKPNAKVWIDIEGKPLEHLGGEGLILEQPITRDSFEANFVL